jgi:hypothetical protein
LHVAIAHFPIAFPILAALRSKEGLFQRDAETNTPEACATQAVIADAFSFEGYRHKR